MWNVLVVTNAEQSVISQASATLRMALVTSQLKRKKRLCKKSDELTTRKRVKKSCCKHSNLRIFASCRKNHKTWRKRKVARKSKSEMLWWCLKPRNGTTTRNCFRPCVSLRTSIRKLRSRMTDLLSSPHQWGRPLKIRILRLNGCVRYHGYQAYQETVSDCREC